MNFKKAIVLCSALALLSAPAFGGGAIVLKLDADGNSEKDSYSLGIPAGQASGSASASSEKNIDMFGIGAVKDGSLIMQGDVTSGAAAGTDEWSQVAGPSSNPGSSSKVSYVGGRSTAMTEISQQAHIGLYDQTKDEFGNVIVDPNGSTGGAFLKVEEDASGREETSNMSNAYLPGFFKTDAKTGATAGQKGTVQWDLDDRGCWTSDDTLVVATHHDEYAGAGLEMGAKISGDSATTSGRFLNTSGDQRTEGVFSNGDATTVVNDLGLDGKTYAYDDCYYSSKAYAPELDTHGSDASGWEVQGGTTLSADQKYHGDSANAFATGSYKAENDFGNDYYGNANGGVQTSIQKFDNMNGSVQGASASMEVTSIMNPSYGD